MGPEGPEGEQGPEGPAGTPGPPALMVDCEEAFRIESATRTWVAYRARVTNASIDPATLAFAYAAKCSHTQLPPPTDPCAAADVTCSGEANPASTCTTVPIHLEAGAIWVDCGWEEWNGGEHRADRWEHARISYRVGQ